MTSRRHTHLIVFLTSDGYHEAGWRMHEFDRSDPVGLQSYIRSTAIAERGLLDAVFFADRLALTPFRARAFPQTHHDPVHGSDGFTLQPATVPEDLELFVDHVVPILQARGLFRHRYAGATLRDHLGLPRPQTTAARSTRPTPVRRSR